MIKNLSVLEKSIFGFVKKQGAAIEGSVKYSAPKSTTGLRLDTPLCTDTVQFSTKAKAAATTPVIAAKKVIAPAYTPYSSAKRAMKAVDDIIKLFIEAPKVRAKSGIIEIAGSKFSISSGEKGTRILTKIKGNIGVNSITITPAKGKPVITIKSDCCSIVDDNFSFALTDEMGNEFVRKGILNKTTITTRPFKNFTDTLKNKDGEYLVAREYDGSDYLYDFTTGKYETPLFIEHKPTVRQYTTEIVDDIKTLGYSQRSVQNQGYQDLVDYMRKDGWTRGPLHVVEMNGKRYSMDNRRLSAATTTNTKPHVVIHAPNERLGDGQKARFRIVDSSTNTEVRKPDTWGEAIFNRLFCNGLVKDGELVFTTKQPSTFPDTMLQTRTDSLASLYQKAQEECNFLITPYFDWLKRHS